MLAKRKFTKNFKLMKIKEEYNEKQAILGTREQVHRKEEAEAAIGRAPKRGH